jgi:hypothetical protein
VPKEPTPEGPNSVSDPDYSGDSNNDDHPGDDDPFIMHLLCCAACRHSISDLYALVDECFQAIEAMRQRMEDLGSSTRKLGFPPLRIFVKYDEDIV